MNDSILNNSIYFVGVICNVEALTKIVINYYHSHQLYVQQPPTLCGVVTNSMWCSHQLYVVHPPALCCITKGHSTPTSAVSMVTRSTHSWIRHNSSNVCLCKCKCAVNQCTVNAIHVVCADSAICVLYGKIFSLLTMFVILFYVRTILTKFQRHDCVIPTKFCK